MEKPAIPKFGSFKPKPRNKSTDRQQANYNDSGPDRSKDDNSIHEYQRHSHYSVETVRLHNARTGSHKQTGSDRTRLSDRSRVSANKGSDLFVSDRTGDSKNVEFGSVHRYDVPNYRRFGSGNVIGSSIWARIDHRTSTQKEIRFENSIQHDRAKPLSSRRELQNDAAVYLVPSIPPGEYDGLDDDFIQLQPSSKRKRPLDVKPSDSRNEKSARHSSPQSKSEQVAESDEEASDFARESDNASENSRHMSEIQRENALLIQKTKETPHLAWTWCLLAEHQAKLIRQDIGASQFSLAERRNLAKVRLSIFKEASEKIERSETQRADLWSCIMKEGIFIWDRAKIVSKWKEALFERSNDFELWRCYLNFIQADGSGFHHTEVKNAYIEGLNALKTPHQVRVPPIARPTEGSRLGAQVYLLLRYTTFLRDSGYSEMAIAIWQGTIEHVCLKPPEIDMDNTEKSVNEFEKFWESEVPRIGEEGACGWYLQSKKSKRSTLAAIRAQMTDSGFSESFASFVEAESDFSHRFTLPAPLDDDLTTVDPFQQVMFSDFRDVIESISLLVPVTSLINAFLFFFGLPSIPSEDSASDESQWLTDPFLLPSSSIFCKQRRNEELLHSEDCQFRRKIESIYSIFEDAFHRFRETMKHPYPAANDAAMFLDRVLAALTARYPDREDIKEYYIAFQLELFPLEATKTAKRLVVDRPTSLRLYNAYALCEDRLHRPEKAERVWSTALEMRTTLSSQAQEDAIYLWHSKLLTDVRRQDDTAALNTLLAIPRRVQMYSAAVHDHQSRSSAKLRTLRELEDGLDRAISLTATSKSTGISAVSVLWATCLAWFTYLTTDYDLYHVFGIYKRIDNRLSQPALPDSHLVAQELLQQSKAQLIKLHIDRKRPYKSALIRQELESSLKSFPSNSMLLELLSKLNEYDRLYSLIRDRYVQDNSQLTVIEWSFRIAEELHKNELGNSGSRLHKMRSIFTKALTDPGSTARSAPALWKLWFTFEFQMAKVLSGAEHTDSIKRVKKIFLDGLRQLPWDKSFALLGMRHLSKGVMSEGELRQVYELMVERGLRIHIEIA